MLLAQILGLIGYEVSILQCENRRQSERFRELIHTLKIRHFVGAVTSSVPSQDSSDSEGSQVQKQPTELITSSVVGPVLCLKSITFISVRRIGFIQIFITTLKV